MKTPLSYYGGKQKLASTIIPLIPTEHLLYAEPFAGGAAILFAKEPSEMEVINDTNKELINFFKVMQQDFVSLEKMVRITLHSRSQHKDAAVIYENPHLFNDLQRAWAVWVLSSQGFAGKLEPSWGYDKSRNTTTKKVANKGRLLTEDYAIRLQNVQVECTDALYIIKSRDSKVAFFYCDPPYFNSNCGHYKGYTEQQFEQLLQTLAGLEGRFLLSSYPSELLERYTGQYGWHTRRIIQRTSVDKGSGRGKLKTEVLTANYEI